MTNEAAIKTLHLTNAWHESSGGIATYYRALLAEATRQQKRIVLVVPGAEDSVEDVSPLARIYRVKAARAPLNPSYRAIYPASFLWKGSSIQRILATERPDVVSICDKYNLCYLGALLRLRLMEDVPFRPTVVGFTCERMDENFATYLGKHGLGRVFSRWYMRWIYFPFFDHHLSISEHTTEELRQASAGHKIARGVWVRPMGVESEVLSPAWRGAEARRRLCERAGIAEDSVLLLYVGRLAPEKNLGLLLETMNVLAAGSPKFHLLLAGEGMERARLMERASHELPGRVHFLGYVSGRRELAELLANADVFLHSNPREPFGIAPLEAMAAGLPVVAPDSGGIREFANAENSALVGPTGEAFARAVLELVENSTLRQARVEAARRTAEAHNWSRTAAAMLQVYETMHVVQQGRLALEEAGAVFVSQPPTRAEKFGVSFFARLAEFAFRAVARHMSAGAAHPNRTLHEVNREASTAHSHTVSDDRSAVPVGDETAGAGFAGAAWHRGDCAPDGGAQPGAGAGASALHRL